MFVKENAERTRRFIGNLVHTSGKWAGKPFDLIPWQWNDVIRPLFGTLKPDGTRQFNLCYIEVPKKDGKTELAAAIGLYCLLADGEYGAEVYSAAGDREQAGLVFKVAAEMVRLDPYLSKVCKVVPNKKRIVFRRTNSFYQVLSSEAYTKHGLNPSCIIFDELHSQPNRDLWETLTVETGAARSQQLIVALTTAGYDRNSICYEVHDKALRVLKHRYPEIYGWVEGEPIDDPAMLPVVYFARDEDDWTAEGTWRRANPSIGYILDIEKIRKACRDAQQLPNLENAFRRLRLNQWVTNVTRWIPERIWRECAGPIDFRALVKHLAGRVCYGGLDLSRVIDLTSLALVFPPAVDLGEDWYSVLSFNWVPKDRIRERSKRDKVPYERWHKSGILLSTPGEVIDTDFIRDKLNDLSSVFDIREVGYDPWGAKKLAAELEKDGVSMVEVRQGFQSMSPPCKELERLVLGRKLRHGNHPILNWGMQNVSVAMDPAENIKPDKSKSTERIDPAVAMIIGISRAMLHVVSENKRPYKRRGIRVLKARR